MLLQLGRSTTMNELTTCATHTHTPENATSSTILPLLLLPFLLHPSQNASSICEMIGICWESNMVEHSLAHHLVPAMNTVSKVLESMTPLLKKIKENKDSAILEHVSPIETSHLYELFCNDFLVDMMITSEPAICVSIHL